MAMNETTLRFKDDPGADVAFFIFIRFHFFLKSSAGHLGIDRPEGSSTRKAPRDGVLIMLYDILLKRIAV